MGEQFFGDSDAAKQGWAIMTAFSAVGSMLSVTYTCVRVKQTIAWTNILPWSPFWRKTAPVPRKEPTNLYELTRLHSRGMDTEHILETGEPRGGLILHWIVCVIYICATAAISVVTEAITFPGQLLTYAHAIVGVVLGLAFPMFHNIVNKVPASRGWEPPETVSWWLRKRFAPYLFGWIYAIGSIALLVLAALGPYKTTDGKERVVKGWIYPVLSFGLVLCSFAYYLAFIASETTSGVRAAGVRLKKSQHGESDQTSLLRRCDACTDEVKPHRHARDGYTDYYEVICPETGSGNIIYWAFGGTNELHHPQVFEQTERMRDGIVNFQKESKAKFQRGQG